MKSMKNPATANFTSTILKCEKICIYLNEEGFPTISIKIHATTNMASLIQGVCFKFTNDKEVVLESGIATLISNAKIAVSDAILDAKKNHVLIIPLKKSVDLMSATKVMLYMAYDRVNYSREFDLE